MFSVDASPTLLIELLDGTTETYTGKMKLPELIKWVEPYVSTEKIERTNENLGKLYMKEKLDEASSVLTTVRSYLEFEEKVLMKEQAAIVYFAKDQDKPHLSIMI